MKVHDDFGIVKCKFCGKELNTEMEIEYSAEVCELFCCPDCATSFYYDYMESKPVDKIDLENLGYKIK